MKKEMLKDYLENGKLNIDKMLDDFYGYVYIIVKNGVSSHITDEDVEEINIEKQRNMRYLLCSIVKLKQ